MTLSLYRRRNVRKLNKKQKGFLLPLALFMIVVASGGVLLMSKHANDSSAGLTLAVVSKQSVYAAETGAQLAVNQLFFPVTNRQQTDARCSTTSINQSFSVIGIDNCRVVVSCVCHYENGNACDATQEGNYNGIAGINDSFYHLDSAASCGSGSFSGQHRTTLDKKFQ